jgi:hypothetical protein
LGAEEHLLGEAGCLVGLKLMKLIWKQKEQQPLLCFFAIVGYLSAGGNGASCFYQTMKRMHQQRG